MKDHPLQEIAAAFETDGDFTAAGPLGNGLIHQTYRVDTTGPTGYVLQRINTDVFKEVEKVQQNIQRVTGYLSAWVYAGGGVPTREVLTLVPTRGGTSFLRRDDGTCWRMYIRIAGARTHDHPTAAVAREAGRAFGRFQQMLAGLPADELHETIPGFHDTPARFAALTTAAAADTAGRARSAAAEIDFAMQRANIVGVLEALHASGSIRRRITHNDTKLNNVMIDDTTGRARCIIDLDTVMPGLTIVDFGDCCRTASASTVEDDPNPGNMHADLQMFDALAAGYLETARRLLTAAEIDHLAFAARLVTFEQGLRFLTDYLQGDAYYKTTRPAQNLDRARTQFALVAEFEVDQDDMQRIVDRYR